MFILDCFNDVIFVMLFHRCEIKIIYLIVAYARKMVKCEPPMYDERKTACAKSQTGQHLMVLLPIW